MDIYLGILILLATITCGFGLECYVCTGQFDNRDKCIKSSIQCRQNHDACVTEINWKAPPFWTPRSEKIHIIDKKCGTQAECNQKQRNLGLTCMRDWYRDWHCFECCQGDRCNYYVTLGASGVTSSTTVLLATLLFCIWLLWR